MWQALFEPRWKTFDSSVTPKRVIYTEIEEALLAPAVSILVPAQLHRLAELYEIEQAEKVYRYVLDAPFLVKVLEEAYEKMGQIFDSASYVLRLWYDFEYGEHHLLLLIRTDLPIEEAIQKLFELDETWWLEASDDIGDYLSIDVL